MLSQVPVLGEPAWSIPISKDDSGKSRQEDEHPSVVSILWQVQIVVNSDLTSSQKDQSFIQAVYSLPVLVIICLLLFTGG